MAVSRKPKRELVSRKEYARRRGVSPNAVRYAIETGRITLVNGKLDPKRADREWRQNTDQSKPRNSVTGRPGAGVGGRRRVPLTYQEARARRERVKAEREELELQIRRGAFLRRVDVERAAFEVGRRVRDQMIALPDKLDATLAASTDPAEVHRILLEEIERACSELVRTLR